VLTASQTRLVAQDKGLVQASYPGNISYLPSSATATTPLWWWPRL
jgi:hypothetical protein